MRESYPNRSGMQVIIASRTRRPRCFTYPTTLIRLDWFDLFDNWFTAVTFYFLLVFLALSVELVDKAVYRRIHIFLDIVGM